MVNEALLNRKAVQDHCESFILLYNEIQPNNVMSQYMKLMLEKGTWFVGHKLAKELPSTQRFVKTHKPKVKQCFYNSQIFVSLNDEGKYYEGYMCDGIIAVHHGWVVIDGSVIDFTLEAKDRKLKRIKMAREKTEPPVYLGVEIPTDFLLDKITETKMCQPYAQCYYLKKDVYFLD